MFSKNAAKRAFRHPLFTLTALTYYLRLHNHISYIKKEISTNFDPEERERFSQGASAGLKEVALYVIIRKEKPKLVLETGVAQGVSTYFILKALKDNRKGQLISIDYPNYNPQGFVDEGNKLDPVYIPKDKKPGWLVKDVTSWRLLLGKSSDILPTLAAPIDMFIHDSDHSYENMHFELEWAVNHVRSGIILADDTVMNEAWSDFLQEHKLRELNYPLSAVKVPP